MKEIPKILEKGKQQNKIDWGKEADAMQRINCRYVVKIVDRFDDDLFGYIVMELCTGGTLADEIAKRKQSGRIFSENVFAHFSFWVDGFDSSRLPDAFWLFHSFLSKKLSGLLVKLPQAWLHCIQKT